jgi:hypothetical protein
MQALFIGQTYIDITFLTDRLPVGDEKHVASTYAVSFGGNAVTAAFCCAKLSIVPDLITTVADDWLGRMFLDMASKYAIPVHPRKVGMSSLSFIMPKDELRAIVRCRDDRYLDAFPTLDLSGCRGLHLDGHQGDAAIHYAKLCREAGILTSLDGGGLRSNTHELLAFIEVAIVAARLCEQMKLTPGEMLDYLKGRGCRIGGVTLGEKGLQPTSGRTRIDVDFGPWSRKISLRIWVRAGKAPGLSQAIRFHSSTARSLNHFDVREGRQACFVSQMLYFVACSCLGKFEMTRPIAGRLREVGIHIGAVKDVTSAARVHDLLVRDHKCGIGSHRSDFVIPKQPFLSQGHAADAAAATL